MIARYTRPEMAAIWSEENKYQKWLAVELAALEGWQKAGVVPQPIVAAIKDQAKVDLERIAEIEKETQHDVIAFVQQVCENLGEQGRFFHFGLTSSDVVDTATALQLREAGWLLQKDLKALEEALREKAWKYRDLPVIGRTHGVHAEPITLGFKFAGWWAEVRRHQNRLEQAIAEISTGKLSGAVGTYANILPEVEEYALKRLGLSSETFSTQVVARDRHAFFICILGLIGACSERIALQVRLLQQTELGELAEPFGQRQKGSSAMPHKRNPILAERVCGLARVIKKNVAVALDNISLWHERDISHSSAERLILPETTILVDYALNLLVSIVNGLEVFPDNIKRNLNHTRGLIFSQVVLSRLVEKGLPRMAAYEIVQKSAFKSLREKRDFYDILRENDQVNQLLPGPELEACFQPGYFLRRLERLFSRMGKER
ncbi:MAG: adenylosuccinate lyase [Candidatus Omnitrophica bacterium]|nr:adenylosuccinate lyase [Candidatus Omnitrophota bacterium]